MGSRIDEEAATEVPKDEAREAEIHALGMRARRAAEALATCPTSVKNDALRAMAASIREHESHILGANALDMKKGRENGLSSAMIDRLDLSGGRVEKMAAALEDVANLDDPVGELIDVRTQPSGLRIGQMRSPIGVIAIIYESRPNVTADAGCLCVKSGNAVILRGGSEAFHSNQAIAMLMAEAGDKAGLPENSIQFIGTRDRAAVQVMLMMDDCIDVIIPRGGKQLIEMIVEKSKIPVIKHLDGICFIYVDESADCEEAAKIIVNSKVQRPGVCNALESLLIHEAIAPQLLPQLLRLLRNEGVEVRGDETVQKIGAKLNDGVKPATEEDWRTEYLDLILTVGTTPSLEAAAAFINANGSHHTDSILTRDHANAMKFLAAVDSACVFINASTRFSDGAEFGLGCEIGISTNKLHARGPMGLRDLTTKKYVAFGDGQLRV